MSVVTHKYLCSLTNDTTTNTNEKKQATFFNIKDKVR